MSTEAYFDEFNPECLRHLNFARAVLHERLFELDDDEEAQLDFLNETISYSNGFNEQEACIPALAYWSVRNLEGVYTITYNNYGDFLSRDEIHALMYDGTEQALEACVSGDLHERDFRLAHVLLQQFTPSHAAMKSNEWRVEDGLSIGTFSRYYKELLNSPIEPELSPAYRLAAIYAIDSALLEEEPTKYDKQARKFLRRFSEACGTALLAGAPTIESLSSIHNDELINNVLIYSQAERINKNEPFPYEYINRLTENESQDVLKMSILSTIDYLLVNYNESDLFELPYIKTKHVQEALAS